MGYWLRTLGWTLAGAVGVTILLAGAARRAAQHQPKFYKQALQSRPEAQREAGDQLEKSVLDLHNEVRRDGAWSAVFSADQINGWLASDLPEKHPQLLPKQVRDPRVAIGEGNARVAFRLENRTMPSVVSVEAEIYLTQQTNEIAVRLLHARAGLLPLPLKSLIDQISQAAAKKDFPLRWSEEQGDPVALVRLSLTDGESGEQVTLQSIDLVADELRVSGFTGSLPETQQHQQAQLRPHVTIQR